VPLRTSSCLHVKARARATKQHVKIKVPTHPCTVYNFACRHALTGAS
jgi:hypothetical protein